MEWMRHEYEALSPRDGQAPDSPNPRRYLVEGGEYSAVMRMSIEHRGNVS